MTRLFILLTGLSGLGITLRAAAYYRGVDMFAFSITMVMAAGLLAGILELLLRAGEIANLRSELKQIVTKAETEPPEDLSHTTGGLRSLLRSHLEQDPMPTRAPLFAPYLVGLLVMLGLLGTFLGLFETLRGAREALSSSADVAALRAGLSSPMAGLMRSFGTSAAGVASSAMLGLGAVFARKAARSLDQAVHHACAHGLSHLSAARRQLSALVALAEQGESLPAAAAALRDAVDAINELRNATSVERDDVRESKQQRDEEHIKRFAALEKLSRDNHDAGLALIREQSTQQAEQAREERKRAIAGLADASGAFSAGLMATTETLKQGLAGLTESLEASQGEAREDFRARADALLERMGSLETSWRQGSEEASEQVRRVMVEGIAEASKAAGETVEPTVARIVEATERSSAAHLQELRRQLGEEDTLRKERDAVQLAALNAHAREMESLLERSRAERAEADAGALARLDAHMQQTVGALDALMQARMAADEQGSERIAAHLTQTLSSIDAAKDARQAADVNTLAAVEAHIRQLQGTSSEQAAALQEGWQTMAEAWREANAAVSERDEQRAAELAAVVARLDSQLSGVGEAVATRLEGLEESDRRQTERAEGLLARMEATGGVVQQSAEKQSALVAELIAHGDERAHAFEQHASSRLEELMQAFSVASTQQVERLAAFEAKLAEHQQAGAETLASQLSQEARQLGEGLDHTGEMVREAAGLVKSAGAELGAAVELFTSGVERHSDAADRWLLGLSVVEQSVEEAGEGAAVEVLGQYLTRTHELFDQQLGFQQELLEQLKTSRALPTVEEEVPEAQIPEDPDDSEENAQADDLVAEEAENAAVAHEMDLDDAHPEGVESEEADREDGEVDSEEGDSEDAENLDTDAEGLDSEDEADAEDDADSREDEDAQNADSQNEDADSEEDVRVVARPVIDA